MRLPTTGREYATWNVTAPADVPLSVSFDKGVTWHPMERPADGQARVLVAGPGATDSPAGTVALADGRNAALIRLADVPEVVIREAGIIHIQG